MFVRDILVSCLRRWYFVVAGLLITGFITYYAFSMVSPTYEAKASVVLIPPSVAVTVGDNPYLYLGGLEQALGVLQVKVASPEVSAALLDKFPGSSIAITKDGTTSGPIMAVTVGAESPEATMQLLKGTLELIPSTLVSLQMELKVPAKSVITVMSLSSDIEPTKISKKQIQMTAMAGVGGLAATLLLTGFIDRLMSREKRSKAQADSIGSELPEAPLGLRGIVSDNTSDAALPIEGPHRRPRARARRKDGARDDSDESVDVGT